MNLEKTVQTITLNKLSTPPTANSREMRAYMQAILEVTGLMAGESFPIELFMGNYRTHLEPKKAFPHPCLLRDGMGRYQLTDKGREFFASRLSETPIIPAQTVDRSDVVQMVRKMVSLDTPDEWEQFSISR